MGDVIQTTVPLAFGDSLSSVALSNHQVQHAYQIWSVYSFIHSKDRKGASSITKI